MTARAVAPRTGRPSGNGRRSSRSSVIGATSQWYKDAIIYEVHVRAFRDSDGDGTGDFSGLTEKLDYLVDLGVTAVWLLPFYPSPLRDDGYDIADYAGVHPDYGTLRDAKTFIREAHRRGLKVITELVCNHTSDQHPWFQRARRAKPGSPQRDFYVWSDTPDRYREARIIFTDTETSNWTWDPVAGAYFWHRFFSHQPDLNFDNPKVREAIIHTMDQWFEMGVDGLRLDAIPYLFERDGTNCENLPETHAFLRELRRHIDERFTDRMLLAEANQWPEDSVAYFGNGDECHMSFHFPLMPRMYMALRLEDRFPIVDILSQTPAIPDTSQWALFLRNHDELTLEMVTDEERDYMYRVYAQDPQMRINVGIRRRLAPLLGNHRHRIELLNGLLFSLPGTPVIYYGDEIGMGDNVYLGDRNGVRTPMQWSGDRNAGFSSANRQSLYFPVITDPEYHYEAVNVEAQQANRNSLLWWMKRVIALRKRHPAFGRGTIEFLQPENRRVLAFTRHHEDDTLLVVANLSRFSQPFELDLSAYAGRLPVEVFGGGEFPRITTEPYRLVLGPHAFMWFTIEQPLDADAEADREAPLLPAAGSLADLATGQDGERLAGILARWMRGRRWYRGKARRIRSADITATLPLDFDGREVLLIVLAVQYAEGEGEEYMIPVTRAPRKVRGKSAPVTPPIARLGSDEILVDAMSLGAVAEQLTRAIGERRRWRRGGILAQAQPTRAFRALGGASGTLVGQPSRAEQSNSSVLIGDRFILKLYRRFEAGTNPDVEIGRFLTERGFANVPALAGSIDLERPGLERATAVTLQALVPNQGDGWSHALDVLGDYLDRAKTQVDAAPAVPRTAAGLLELAGAPVDPMVNEAVGAYLDQARLLGERTAELHLALASDPVSPAFAPERAGSLYQRSVYQSIRSSARLAFELLRRRRDTLAPGLEAAVDDALGLEGRVGAMLAPLVRRNLGGEKIRCHGDFHLGQTLYTGRDYLIIDFEGEPGRPLSERRIKRTPLVDVAGMLRSFHYAARGALVERTASGAIRPEDVAALEPWTEAWASWVSGAYLAGYREAARGAGFLPVDDEAWASFLDALLLQKAFYELDYELNNRPTWVGIPLSGIAGLLRG